MGGGGNSDGGGSSMKAIQFGSPAALSKHDVKTKTTKYVTPAPGSYEVHSSHKFKFANTAQSSFGGQMCLVSREKTGLNAEGMRKVADPGPSHYSIDASQQAIKAKDRSPTFKFGSSTRDDGAKAYIYRGDSSGTADPNRSAAGKGVPGPGNYGVSNMSANKTRYPQYSFGARHADLTQSTTKAIGPGAYESPSSLGRQTSSARPSSSNFSMGSASRDKVQNVLSPGFNPIPRSATPAPGTYRQGSGVGRQTSSLYHSASAFSFGSDERIKQKSPTTTVPGPGRYSNASTLGIQHSSRYGTSGSFKFGTSDRAGLAEGLVG